ncbi:MAG TPA: tyrosine-type recombinase/integrase [Gemmataceae bacterium]|jgi:integrase
MSELYKKQTTVWRLEGKKVSPGTPGAVRETIDSRKWYGTVNGKATPLSRDKAVAAKMLRKLLGDADLAGVGLVDPFAEHRKNPLTDHLKGFRTAMEGKGGTPKHVDLTMTRLLAVLNGIKAVWLSDLDAVRAADFLTAKRADRPAVTLPLGKESFRLAEAAELLGLKPAAVSKAVWRNGLNASGAGKARRFPRSTVQALADKAALGMSAETFNHHVRALRAFGRWLARERRWPVNPFETMALLNVSTDRRHDRRELTADELRQLMEAARNSTWTFRGLAGRDRWALYLTACGTGFRVRALAGLTPEDFDLSANMPSVTLPARLSKNKKGKVQPLPADVADALRSYLADKPADQPIWPGNWNTDAAEMLRIDLDAAGIAYIVEGPDGPLYADFHALRHSYLTLGGRSGIDLRTLQELAGHSSPTITARYSHRRLHDLAGAVEKLPRLLPKDENGALQATGTDGRMTETAEKICLEFARPAAPLGHSGASSDPKGDLKDSDCPFPKSLDTSALGVPCPLPSSVSRLGLEPRTYGLTYRTGFRPPTFAAAVWTLSSPPA